MKITLDTNVLVSGTFWTGDSFKIMDMIDNHKLENVTSKEIMEEYNKTINSDAIIDKIERKSLLMQAVAHKVIENSHVVEPTIKINVVQEDSNDNKIIECAKAGNVDYIITNDKHLLKLKSFENIKIISPSDFLKIFNKY